MKRRISRGMYLLCVVSVLLVSLALSYVFYNGFAGQARDSLRDFAHMYRGRTSATVLDDMDANRPEHVRVTLMRADGVVVYDSFLPDGNTDNHAEREEIQEALTVGAGESSRTSDTIGVKTFYYAIRLEDGTILRVATTIDSIWSVFAEALPVAALIMVLAMLVGYFLAKGITQKVMEPITSADPKSPDIPYDELAPMLRTIAEHREQIDQGNRQLRNRAETIDIIMEHMSEGVALLDRHGNVLTINKSAADIFDTRGSMVGHNALEVLRDLAFVERIRQALQGEKGEMNLRRAGREYRVMISPVAETGVAVFVLDITEKARAERLRREFSANVSHELKTPLTSIYGSVEMLREGLVREEDRQLFYGKVMDETSRLIALVEDIMMLSKLDEGNAPQQLEKVQLRSVAEACRQALAHAAQARRIQVEIDGDAEMVTNRSLLYEMLYNLIDNAIKYNKQEGQVFVGFRVHSSEVEICVRDTGIGIPLDEQKRIFERFYRVEKSRSQKTGGTGLGLAIVKHVVMILGGSICVQSAENQGAVFTVTFPH